jgi:hypothetical protein
MAADGLTLPAAIDSEARHGVERGPRLHPRNPAPRATTHRRHNAHSAERNREPMDDLGVDAGDEDTGM